MKWNSSPDVHDWPHFKPTLIEAVEGLVSNATSFDLKPADGPLSRQYKARWTRVHAFAPMKEAIAFSDEVFDAYRENHYQAGCHLGVISCYALQLLLVNLRDVEGRLQKQVSSVAQLINIHAPYQHMVKTDWPVFRLLHFASLLQRAPPDGAWQGEEDELSASKGAAEKLVSDVEEVLSADAKSDDSVLPPIAFFSFAWGWMSAHVSPVLQRWKSLSIRAPLILLARDKEASAACAKGCAGGGVAKNTRCVVAPQRLGVETMVAKYLALASAVRLGVTAVWFDLDVFVVSDPTPLIIKEMAQEAQPDLVFARHLLGESVSPAVVIARNTTTTVSLLMGYAGWLRENPFLLDHQGWDQYLNNRVGDFAGGFDYKGRTITVKKDEGPNHTFLPTSGVAPAGTNWRYLSTGFGSGDGWLGPNSVDALTLFHFWGVDDSQEKLFKIFYQQSSKPAGLSPTALEIMLRYRRAPVSGPTVSALLGNRERRKGVQKQSLHLVAVSYAHGCCGKSLKKNQQQALKVGVDEARAYGKADLGPAWAERNDLILSQKKGAGWWLWKPHLILKTLRDPAVPWNRGVVLWVDAGNFLHANPRPLLESSLQGSDVVALRLKWCLEADWTSIASLRTMNVSDNYAMVDRPQLGAYFLAFRKTKVSIAFVEEWLRLSEDPVALLGSAANQLVGSSAGKQEDEVPSFNSHQADQSVFSILYKRWGFRPISLEEGHRVVTLARWRE